ncbi:MAG: LysR family transcriptional regulator [Pseudomonadota bacterium]
MRTAMMVAQLGTVRAAAKRLGIHRATVTRHIDALEADLGVKLFLRHAEGYALTNDGEALKKLAESTDRLIGRFVNETADMPDHLTGAITISTLVWAAPLIADGIRSFCADHPGVTVKVNADSGLSKLELGQADLAIRAGPKPANPDYVVLSFRKILVGLFGHNSLFDPDAAPMDRQRLLQQRFVGIQTASGAIDVCQAFDIPSDKVCFVTNDPSIALSAIEAGIGLGIVSEIDYSGNDALHEVFPQSEPMEADIWLVTHVDLHRTRLIQAILPYLRS